MSDEERKMSPEMRPAKSYIPQSWAAQYMMKSPDYIDFPSPLTATGAARRYAELMMPSKIRVTPRSKHDEALAEKMEEWYNSGLHSRHLGDAVRYGIDWGSKGDLHITDLKGEPSMTALISLMPLAPDPCDKGVNPSTTAERLCAISEILDYISEQGVFSLTRVESFDSNPTLSTLEEE